jgi:hypothetical protein
MAMACEDVREQAKRNCAGYLTFFAEARQTTLSPSTSAKAMREQRDRLVVGVVVHGLVLLDLLATFPDATAEQVKHG